MSDMNKVAQMEYIGDDADDRPTNVPYGCRAYICDLKKWEITKDGGTTWEDFIEPGQPNIKVDLEDEETYVLPDASSGFAVVKLGSTNNYRAVFHWDASGNIVMLDSGGSSYVRDKDTDGYLCIYKSGTQIVIKNQVGSKQTLKILRMV